MRADELPTIPAAKNRLGDALIYWLLIRYPLWNSFERVSLKFNGPLPSTAQGPLIVYLNHPGWWDGHICFLLDRIVLQGRFDSYVMMEERQLRAYRFFRWSGAFSVDRDDKREGSRAVNYSSQLLRRQAASLLYIFPQGKLTPNDQRPLTIYPGIGRIVQQVGAATLLPVAVRYEFRGEQRPEALLLVGPAHRVAAPVDPAALSEELRCRLTANADALRDALVENKLAGFQPLVRGRAGVNRVFDQVFGRLMRRVR